MKKQASFYESGQALVLVLLSLSVVLTMVLFVLSRSVNDIANSTEQADSVRAFSAAEAGVENALITGVGTNGSVTIGNASYSVDVSSYSAESTTFNYLAPMLSGDNMTLWFVSHKDDGSLTCDTSYPSCFKGNTLKVCWGTRDTSSSSNTTPAIEVSVYYEDTPGDTSTVKIARATYDPYTTRPVPNSFSAAAASLCQIDGVDYAFQNTITLSDIGGINNDGLLFAKIRMLYNTTQAHSIGVSVASSGYTLPSQGLEIVSTGTSSTTGGQTGQSNRRVNVFRGWPEFPLSGLAVVVPTGITK